MEKSPFDRIEEAITELKQGKVIIVCDDDTGKMRVICSDC